jgi:hypothetical protein
MSRSYIFGRGDGLPRGGSVAGAPSSPEPNRPEVHFKAHPIPVTTQALRL